MTIDKNQKTQPNNIYKCIHIFINNFRVNRELIAIALS